MGYKVKNTNKFMASLRKTGNSQSEFAFKVGVSPQWLSSVAHQRKCASKTLATLISKEMNVDLEDVFLNLGVALVETKTNNSVDKTETKEEIREWKSSKLETTKQ